VGKAPHLVGKAPHLVGKSAFQKALVLIAHIKPHASNVNISVSKLLNFR